MSEAPAPIRLGIAGVRHPHIDSVIEAARRRDDVTLVGIAETDDRLRETYSQRYGVRAFDEHTHLFDGGNVDAVAVGDVFGARGRIVADALSAGLHVLSDKPLCTTRADLDAIHAAWRGDGQVLSIAFEKRLAAPTVAMERVLAEGEIGDIVMISSTGPHKLLREQRPDWMFRRATYGGILNDLTVHDVDLMLHFTGARTGAVTARAGNRAVGDHPEFEDHGLAMFDVHDGPVASVDAHWLNPEAAPYHGDYRMRVVGTRGTADLLWKNEQLIVGSHTVPPRPVALPPKRLAADDFLDALRDGRAPAVTAADALAATSVALAAQESADTGRPTAWDVGEFRTPTQ